MSNRLILSAAKLNNSPTICDEPYHSSLPMLLVTACAHEK